MFNDVKLFHGYVWYAYPLKREDKHGLMMADGEKMPLRCFLGAKAFSNYNDDGVLIVTETPEKPLVSKGWDVIPCNVPDGFGGTLDDGRVIRHVVTLEETPEGIYSVFVGLKPERKI